ncbi:MAG: NAD(P)-dependent oxidoreductase [Lautropia sp.]
MATPRAERPEPTLGIVGLGLVGRALAGRLIDAGYAVAGCDIAVQSAAQAALLGVRIVDDAAELATQCQVLVVCVFDDAQFAAVVAAVTGAVAAVAADPDPRAAPPADPLADPMADPSAGARVLINTSTCSPAVVDAMLPLLIRHGIDFIELPLSGSSAQIRDGNALALLGGDAAAIGRWQPVLDCLGPNQSRVGPPGTAARVKLASNLILGLNRAALAEGLALAEALGLDGDDFLALLRRSPAYSRAVDTVGDRMVARDFRPLSRLAQHRKDLALIVAQGDALGQPLPLARAHAALLDHALALGHGELDNAAVFAALRPDSPPPR